MHSPPGRKASPSSLSFHQPGGGPSRLPPPLSILLLTSQDSMTVAASFRTSQTNGTCVFYIQDLVFRVKLTVFYLRPGLGETLFKSPGVSWGPPSRPHPWPAARFMSAVTS